MPKITKRLVDAAEPRDNPYTIYDGQVPGFGIRVQPGGTKTYVVLYRFAHHRRCVSLGHHGVTTPEQARTSAINILARVRNGEDPAASRQSDGHVTTVADLAKRFDEEHIAVHLKPASARSYRDSLRRHVLPAIGKFRAADVARADVAKLHHDLRQFRYQANQSLAVMSKMFNLAEVWGVRPTHSNPCWGIKKYPEEKRKRYLSGNELARLGETLRECQESRESQSTVNLIRLLLLTGLPAQRNPDAQMGARGPREQRASSARFQDRRKDGLYWRGSPGMPRRDQADRRQSLGYHGSVILVSPGQPRQALAAHPGAGRSRRRTHSRSAPHLRVHGGLDRRRPTDNRQAAGPHSGTDHGSLCPSVQRARQTSSREYFIQYRGGVEPERLLTPACGTHKRARSPMWGENATQPQDMPVWGSLGL